jgi:hypothetical protein
MKTLMLSAIISIGCTILCLSNTNELFTYDASKIDQEMAQLQSLEDYIYANPDVTPTNLQLQNCIHTLGLNINNELSSCLSTYGDEPMGISPFWWGCCFGVWGILIVYLVSEDKDQTKIALKGCVIGSLIETAVGVVCYAVYFLWLTTYWPSWY